MSLKIIIIKNASDLQKYRSLTQQEIADTVAYEIHLDDINNRT